MLRNRNSQTACGSVNSYNPLENRVALKIAKVEYKHAHNSTLRNIPTELLHTHVHQKTTPRTLVALFKKKTNLETTHVHQPKCPEESRNKLDSICTVQNHTSVGINESRLNATRLHLTYWVWDTQNYTKIRCTWAHISKVQTKSTFSDVRSQDNSSP